MNEMGYVREATLVWFTDQNLKQRTEKAGCYSSHFPSKAKGTLVVKYDVHNTWTVDPDLVQSPAPPLSK